MGTRTKQSNTIWLLPDSLDRREQRGRAKTLDRTITIIQSRSSFSLDILRPKQMRKNDLIDGLPAAKCNGVDLRPAVSRALTFCGFTTRLTRIRSPLRQDSNRPPLPSSRCGSGLDDVGRSSCCDGEEGMGDATLWRGFRPDIAQRTVGACVWAAHVMGAGWCHE